jgi:HD-like signal output (HDOD) protein
MVLLSNFGETYDKIIKDYEGCEAILREEKAAFGVTHQELGAYILDWWGMPYSFVETALNHHSPLDNNVIGRDMICAVHLADYFAWPTDTDRFRHATLDELVLAELNLTANRCLKLAGSRKN